MPAWMGLSDLPLKAATGTTPASRYLDEAAITRLLAQGSAWPGNVNAGGYTLSNVGAITGASLTSTGALKVTVGLTNSTDETDVGWSYIRSGSAAGDCKLLIGTGSLGTYVQSMEQGVDFATKPLNLQPNGGNVLVGGLLGIGQMTPTFKVDAKTSGALSTVIGSSDLLIRGKALHGDGNVDEVSLALFRTATGNAWTQSRWDLRRVVGVTQMAAIAWDNADLAFTFGGTEKIRMTSGGLLTTGSAWNGGHQVWGAYHLWIDASGKFRIKSGAPVSDTDGTVVGTQT